MAGKVQLDIIPTDLFRMLEQTLCTINFSPPGKELHPTLLVEPNVPLNVYMDPHRVQQVLVNLLNNATKFTPDGGDICLWVRPTTAQERHEICARQGGLTQSFTLASELSGPGPTGFTQVRTSGSSGALMMTGTSSSGLVLTGSPSGAALPSSGTSPSFSSGTMRAPAARELLHQASLDSLPGFVPTEPCVLGPPPEDAPPPPNVCVVALEVIDSGIGISPDMQLKVFEAFEQGDKGTNRKFGGTGLGLTICKNLALAMGGTVAVASPAALPGQPRSARGTKFSLLLPLEVVHASATKSAPSPWQLSLSRDRDLRVVVAVGHPLTFRQVTQMLDAFRVQWSEDVAEFHAAAARARDGGDGGAPAALLFDAHHPQGEALEGSRHLRDRVAMVAPRSSKACGPHGLHVLALPVRAKALAAWLEETAAALHGTAAGLGPSSTWSRKADPCADLGGTAASPSCMSVESLASEGKRVVLVAEDIRVNQVLVTKQLEQLDCQALICDDGLKVM